MLWNTFQSTPSAVLTGHETPVLAVDIDDSFHLYSLSADKVRCGNGFASFISHFRVEQVIKVWDLRTFKTIETFIDDRLYSPEDRLCTLRFDQKRFAVLGTSNRLHKWTCVFLFVYCLTDSTA